MAQDVDVDLVTQVVPPSVVTIVPPDARARHVAVVGQLIPVIALCTTFGCNVTQFAPPSVVFNAVPHSPTARQTVALGQLTDRSPLTGVGLPADQWTPPSAVKTATAPAFVPPPTATQAVDVAQLIALRGVDVLGET